MAKKIPFNKAHRIAMRESGLDKVKPVEAAVKKPKGVTLNQLAQMWSEGYGEDLANDYAGVYDVLYEQYGNKEFGLEDLNNAWKNAYGEDFAENYSGVWQDLGGTPTINLDEALEDQGTQLPTEMENQIKTAMKGGKK
jgi:hypothetical protein